MKKFIKILTAVSCFLAISSTAVAQSFSDIPESHPKYAAVESLKNLGVVKGYEDGTFRPDKLVTRVEALKMILVSAKIDVVEQNMDTGFSDAPGDQWYAAYVAKARDLGIVSGNSDGSFTPMRNVIKAEYLKMMLESFDVDLSKHMNLTEGVSSDTSAGSWDLPYMSYAKAVGIIYPEANDMLYPTRELTRGDCAEIAYQLLVLENGGELQKMLNLVEANIMDSLAKISINDIDAALGSASSAVFYSEQALSQDPENSLVKAVNKLAMGYQKVFMGYTEARNDNFELAKTYSQEAIQLAGDAYADDTSTQPWGKNIKLLANEILANIPS